MPESNNFTLAKTQQQTAQNIIEIGRRLIKVKESLPHGEWGTYLKEKVDFTQETARKFMKISNEFGNSNSVWNLGSKKLWLLLELPSEERNDFMAEKHEIKGQSKTVDEMTTRELQ